MSTLLILLLVAVAVYAAAGLLATRSRPGPASSVAEFSRALAALDPGRRRARRRRARRAAARRSGGRRSPAGSRRADPPSRRAA